MRLTWDQVGERLYETGVDHGVLYLPDGGGNYTESVAWNGLVTVTESPSGAEASPQYADNVKYLNLLSAEEFGGTIEAFTYPDEFAACDGTAQPVAGLSVGQQGRRTFGFAYRTRVGNDVDGTDFGYKIHLVYGALAAPSEKPYGTVNDSPEAITFSWEISTTPVEVPGTNPLTGKPYKPTATIIADSTKLSAATMAELEDILYGTEGVDGRLPLPGEVIALFAADATVVEPVPPAYNAATHTITIPATAGVEYRIGGVAQPPGDVVIAADTVVTAVPTEGNVFPAVVDDDWFYNF